MLVQLAIFHTTDAVILQLRLEASSLKITRDLYNQALALFQTPFQKMNSKKQNTKQEPCFKH